MYRFCLYFSVALVVILSASFANAQTSVCTGYPKMYNGLPCASTTRYYDGQMGACGCGTGNTSPFSWQWTKPTAAASAPVFGSGTWCGTGCGKCFRLTPTAVGVSPDGTGAPNLTPVVIKVTNLCPYTGNEQWCAYDVNSFGYEAHFDLMDYNMNGLISSMGWNNPEVTYEEVDCDTNGYADWSCQCAAAADSDTATAAPTSPSVATTAPTAAPIAATKAPVAATTAPIAATTAPIAATAAPIAATTAPIAATTAPVAATTAVVASTGNVQIQVNGGSNNWWVGFSLVNPAPSAISYVEIVDSSGSAWAKLSYQGNSFWNLYSYNPSAPIVLPLSLRFTGTDGTVKTANNIITSFQATTVDTGLAV